MLGAMRRQSCGKGKNGSFKWRSAAPTFPARPLPAVLHPLWFGKWPHPLHARLKLSVVAATGFIGA
jgi:hypothetical protein